MRSFGYGVAIEVVIIGVGKVIEVSTIGVGEMGFSVVTCCMGGEGIRTSVMRFAMKAFIGMTCWIGTVRTLHEMIGIGTGAANFAISGAFFVATSSASSFISSGCQKKVYSETRFGIGDVGDVGTLEGEGTLFMSSVSGIQKKDRSVMGFMRGVTGDEMTFLGGAIQNFTTCCMGVSCEGTGTSTTL